MPMWFTGCPKATRSPGRAASSEATAVPICACSPLVRGTATPRSAYARCTRPEQSSPVAGSVPPHTYGTPRYCFAEVTASAPMMLCADLSAAPVDDIVSARIICALSICESRPSVDDPSPDPPLIRSSVLSKDVPDAAPPTTPPRGSMANRDWTAEMRSRTAFTPFRFGVIASLSAIRVGCGTPLRPGRRR